MKAVMVKCKLYHCLEWYKWALTNLDHDRQWFNTFHRRTSHCSGACPIACRSVGLKLSKLGCKSFIYFRFLKKNWTRNDTILYSVLKFQGDRVCDWPATLMLPSKDLSIGGDQWRSIACIAGTKTPCNIAVAQVQCCDVVAITVKIN